MNLENTIAIEGKVISTPMQVSPSGNLYRATFFHEGRRMTRLFEGTETKLEVNTPIIGHFIGEALVKVEDNKGNVYMQVEEGWLN